MRTIYESPVRYWFASFCGVIVSAFADRIRHLASNGKLKKRIVLTFATAALVGGALAMAQMDPSADAAAIVTVNPGAAVERVPPRAINAMQLATSIAGSVDSAVAGLRSNGTIKGMGNTTMFFGLFLGMLWAGLKTMIGGKGIGELIGEWTPLFVSAGVITALLDANGAEQIISTMDKVGSAIANGIDVSNARALLPSAADQIFKSIGAIIDMPMISSPGIGDVMTGSIVTIALVGLGVFLMKVLVAFLIVIAGCVYMATAIMAMVSVGLVMGLAPLMVPFLIFKPMSWVFDSWLRFLLGACMMKVVGAFMLNLTTALLLKMTEVAAMAKADAAGVGIETLTADIVLYSFMVLLAVLAGLLMAQVPTIATGLLQGNAGSAGFKGVGGVTQGVGGRVGSAAAVSGGGSAYRGALGNKLAENKGRSDAAAGLPSSVARYKSDSQHRSYTAAHASTRQAMKPK